MTSLTASRSARRALAAQGLAAVGAAGALVLAGLAPVTAAPAPASASPAPGAALRQGAPGAAAQQGGSTSFALFGDTPYGDAAIEHFPQTMREISTGPGIEYAVHVGDIKNGSTRCDTDYFQWVRTQFDASRVPLVYTPGDNEWVDCHRPNNGAYNPLERLSALRQTFFSRAGQGHGAPGRADHGTPGHGAPGRSTLGHGNLAARSQAAEGFPENVAWTTNKVEFAAVNVQGSHNDLDPWSGLGKTAATPEQRAEFQARQAANVRLIEGRFAQAEQRHSTGVAIVMQADMFDSYLAADPAAAREAFGPVIQAIADGARRTGLPVYILNGDSHKYKDQRPLAAGSPWAAVYGQAPVQNIRQITVEGAAEAHEYTRVTVASPSQAGRPQEPLSFTRVPIQ
ncbi:metallophosphoesterase family protein [Arthrobacter sp. UM1]|uniref:metallophosphoesterase family protein n=1 Tax=Arthrobacter sp. UM1 TaxID=2766776 RepID=UPI001CF68512|nr:metallophosphoesterase family protein [Arthrobacter sp. UM1]MCB4208564.1 metallophosphoesterase [Arthrobacter sp. UM1]